MSSMSTRFDYVIYVEMDWYAVGRHVLTTSIFVEMKNFGNYVQPTHLLINSV